MDRSGQGGTLVGTLIALLRRVCGRNGAGEASSMDMLASPQPRGDILSRASRSPCATSSLARDSSLLCLCLSLSLSLSPSHSHCLLMANVTAPLAPRDVGRLFIPEELSSVLSRILISLPSGCGAVDQKRSYRSGRWTPRRVAPFPAGAEELVARSWSCG